MLIITYYNNDDDDDDNHKNNYNNDNDNINYYGARIIIIIIIIIILEVGLHFSNVPSFLNINVFSGFGTLGRNIHVCPEIPTTTVFFKCLVFC